MTGHACKGGMCNGQQKKANKYLCATCWFGLSVVARRALRKRDHLAVRRLAELCDQLNNDVPPSEIQIQE